MKQGESPKSPLPCPNPVHIMPTPAAQSIPEAPATKAKASPSALLVQNFRKLVVIVQTCATTSKDIGSSYCMAQWMVSVLVQIWSTWTSAIPPALPVPATSKGLRNWFGETQSPPLFVFFFLCFILFYSILF